MKRNATYLILLILFVLCSCSTAPEVIPDPTDDSVAMLRLKEELKQIGNPVDNKNWLWWYAPVAIISLMWAVKHLFLRKCIEEDPDIIPSSKETQDDKVVQQPAEPDAEAIQPDRPAEQQGQ
jgi:hypothetical protein